jgi:hypothetical protein
VPGGALLSPSSLETGFGSCAPQELNLTDLVILDCASHESTSVRVTLQPADDSAARPGHQPY